MRSSEFDNLSAEPAALRGMTPAQQERLTELLDQYLSALERGVPPSVEDLIATAPDLTEPLRDYVNRLQELHAVAAGFHAPGAGPAETVEPPAANAAGRLGDFVLIREIGRGGMGIVYEARQISLDRRVALKVLPFAAVLDAKQIARFKNESQAAAQLHHPHIVSVFAVGVERGVHYYAMQYIDGQPLDVAIAQLRERRRQTRQRGLQPGAAQPALLASTRHSPLSTRAPDSLEYFQAIARLGMQAAQALHCAHEHGVVHRDIKPSNLLLDFEGKLWVTDFGLARFQTDVTLTRTGDMVGTMRYMSPEQATGRSVLVDHRTDVYSLGITLYELLTLCPAFRDDEGPALLRRIERHEPLRPRRLNAQIPVDLESVVLKAIVKSRDDRYATADELAADLQRFLDGVPTAAKPPGVLEGARKWVRRHRKMVAAGAACAALGLGMLLVAALLVLQQHAEKQAALAAAERNLQRAEANFHQAKQAVDEFGACLAERLAGIPGVEPLRRELLGETLRYYEGFIKQAADDPSLQEDIAITYSKIGGITERTGRTNEALAAYRQAVAVLERLLQRQEDARAAQTLLALCRSNLGLLLARTGQADEGLRQVSAALEIQRGLAENFPDEPSFRAAVALTHNNLGLLKSQLGENDQAERCYLAALEAQRELRRQDPQDSKLLRNMAGTLNNLSMLHSRTRLATAVEFAEEALQLRRQLGQANSADPEVLNELALACNNTGALYSRQNQNPRAVEAYSEAIRLQTRLTQLAPAVVAYRGDLAVSYNNLGLLHSQQEDHAAALKAFRQALTIQQELVERVPDDPDFISSLAGIYNNLGMVLLKQHASAPAVEAFQTAVRLQEDACRRSPAIARYREFLSKHRVNLGRAQQESSPGAAAAGPTSPGAPARSHSS